MSGKRARAPRPVTAVPVFAALGDPVRFAIVARLCRDGPLPTIQLKQGTSVSRQAVTKHLRALEDAGLVQSGRIGRDRLWQLETGQLAEVRKYLDRISAQWDATLQRLRRLVEDDSK
jgi:DNA-binding transcriptional ArsR family regulator